ncbi:9738_t:CDS:2, partial [Ambispora leptoticha]
DQISTDKKQSEKKKHSRHNKIADLNIDIINQESLNNLPFSKVTAKLLIHLAPPFLKNVEAFVMEYFEEILLSIPDGAGYLFDDAPFANIWSPTHIGMLLYRYYNASIPIQYIPTDKFRWRPNKEWIKPTLDIESVSLGNWIDLENNHVIEKDDEVAFEVVE